MKVDNESNIIEKVKSMTYSQDWQAYNQAKTQEKTIALLLIGELAEKMDELHPRLPGEAGRPSISIKDRLVAMYIYTFNKSSSRRSIPDIKLAMGSRIVTKTPHFNTILSFFKTTYMMKILMQLLEITALPLVGYENHISVDSSGFSCSDFEQWFNIRTQSNEKKRKWMKAHIVSGSKTNIITSVAVTEATEADCPELIPLVENTTQRFEPKELSADKAYLSRENLKFVSSKGMIPFIPFKSNSTQQPKGYKIWSTMFHFFHSNNEEFMIHYHQRSKVESTFGMMKRNFGYKLRTKRTTSQINEILMKCICHNLSVLVQESFELGLEIDLRKCADEYFAQKQD